MTAAVRNCLSDVSWDVLVVGAGAAGLYAALCLPDRYRVGLITKASLKMGASDWAQGGIAAAIASNDSPEQHLKDTLRAGAELCDRTAVEFLVTQAPAAIASLVEMGVAFDRQGGHLALTLEAAHTHPRVLHAADTTGRAIVSTLTEQVQARSNIHVIERGLVLELWIEGDRCRGLCLLYRGRVQWLRASAVILATGGGGQVFAQTTNPSVSTGDGVALAWRAGAVIQDPEFVQFHPTALMKAGAPHFLISEAVRGEGAHLIDATGERFAFHYHPDGELAPRDVVSRAIYSHLQKNANNDLDTCVYLDLRPIERNRLSYRFPNILQRCQQWGIDPLKEPIPVAPAAHYWMGGIRTDLSARTSIAGLYAIGETASTGVHGANRLASNSLLECVVFAAQLAQLSLPLPDRVPPVANPAYWQESVGGQKLRTIRQELPILIWQNAGICRTQSLLEGAIGQIQHYQSILGFENSIVALNRLEPFAAYVLELDAEESWQLAAETRNLSDIAYLILRGAAFRRESRGGHFRSDYPQTDPQWRGHTLIQGDRLWFSPLSGA